jgi:hypothetical protein
MLTRRQWLQTNPRPKSPVNLQALLDEQQRAAAAEQDQITQIYNQLTVANQAGKTADAAKLQADLTAARTRQATTSLNITQLSAEIAKAVKCPIHGLGLHFHRNRPEDLYVCENGPHFLFWTLVGKSPQLSPVATLMLPGLDYPMTEGTKISRMEWLSQHPPQTAAGCPEHAKNSQNPAGMKTGANLTPFTERPVDIFVCDVGHEKYIWTSTPAGPALVLLAGEPPSLEAPID